MNFFRVLNLVLAMLLVAFVVTCTNKKINSEESEAHPETDADEWKEMDEFHMVMAESFHPYMDSGNIAPAKENAAMMEKLASKWAVASLPAKMDNDEVKRKLKALQLSTTNFKSIASQADDKVVADSLARLHDLFHSIQESWYGGGEHHNH